MRAGWSPFDEVPGRMPGPRRSSPPPGAEGADTGEARFSNLFGAPAFGVTTRLRWLALGAAFYAPFGGRLQWDKNQRFVGDPTFPQAADGVQRWTITEGALTYLYFTMGAAVRVGRLAVGVTGNLIHSSVKLTQAKSANPQQDVIRRTSIASGST